MVNASTPTEVNTTVVICCAGMGTRLGIGTTKALLDVCGEPLIIRQLKHLQKYDDIRIVVGFQAERLIKVVNQYRRDIMYVFNYDYETSGVADSLRKALFHAREYVIYLDGDTLGNPEDFEMFLKEKRECIPISTLTSAEPVKARISNGFVTKLSRTDGAMQWPGMVKMRASRLRGTSPHVYDMINTELPLLAIRMRARGIDTPEDYEHAIEWFKNGCGE